MKKKKEKDTVDNFIEQINKRGIVVAPNQDNQDYKDELKKSISYLKNSKYPKGHYIFERFLENKD